MIFVMCVYCISVFLHEKGKTIIWGFLGQCSESNKASVREWKARRYCFSQISVVRWNTFLRITRDSKHWQEFSVYGLARSGRLNSCPFEMIHTMVTISFAHNWPPSVVICYKKTQNLEWFGLLISWRLRLVLKVRSIHWSIDSYVRFRFFSRWSLLSEMPRWMDAQSRWKGGF